MLARTLLIVGLATFLAMPAALLAAEEGDIDGSDIVVSAGGISTGTVITQEEKVADVSAEEILGKVAELRGLLTKADTAIQGFLALNRDQSGNEYHCEGDSIAKVRGFVADIEESLSQARASAEALSLFYTSNLLGDNRGVYNLSTKSYLTILRAYDEVLEILSHYNMCVVWASNSSFDARWSFNTPCNSILPGGGHFVTVPRLGLLAQKHYDHVIVKQEVSRNGQTTVTTRDEFVNTTNFFKLVMIAEDEKFVTDSLGKGRNTGLQKTIERLQAIRKEIRTGVRSSSSVTWEFDFGKDGKANFEKACGLSAEYFITFVKAQSQLNRLKFLVMGNAYDYTKADVKSDLVKAESELQELHKWGTTTTLQFDTFNWLPSDNLKMKPLACLAKKIQFYIDLDVDFGVGAKGFVVNVNGGAGYDTVAPTGVHGNKKNMTFSEFYTWVRDISSSDSKQLAAARDLLNKFNVQLTLDEAREMSNGLFSGSYEVQFMNLMADYLSKSH